MKFRLNKSTVMISNYWCIPVVLLVLVEMSVASRFLPSEEVLRRVRKVEGVYKLSGSTRAYTASIDGQYVYFDPNAFGDGVSVRAGSVPNGARISAYIVDIPTSSGNVPVPIHIESKGTVYLDTPSSQLLHNWKVGTVFFGALGAFILAAVCFVVGMSVKEDSTSMGSN